jgi:hypothetical protein
VGFSLLSQTSQGVIHSDARSNVMVGLSIFSVKHLIDVRCRVNYWYETLDCKVAIGKKPWLLGTDHPRYEHIQQQHDKVDRPIASAYPDFSLVAILYLNTRVTLQMYQ